MMGLMITSSIMLSIGLRGLDLIVYQIKEVVGTVNPVVDLIQLMERGDQPT